MRISDFSYYLPKELIAQKPAIPRDYARLLTYDRQRDDYSDAHFFDLVNMLNSNDVLVFNNSKVSPVRFLFGDNNNKEVFFLSKVDGLWKVMVRPGRFFVLGKTIKVDALHMEVKKIDEHGYRFIKVNLSDSDLALFLNKHGALPLPPYIDSKDIKKDDYNTVFAKEAGSVATPTAGLHFNKSLLSKLTAKGVKIEFITLEVGLGTFLPVKTHMVEDHKMHEESYNIDYYTAKRLNKYKKENRRIIAVGTTSVRTLEDNFSKYKGIRAGRFQTNIFIRPGYKWGFIDAIITNFHLPESTLLILVSAFIGKEKALWLYKRAVSRRYRFFSFGDGMFLT